MNQLTSKIVNKLSGQIGAGKFSEMHRLEYGVRSQQVGALIELLVDLGVVTEAGLRKLEEKD